MNQVSAPRRLQKFVSAFERLCWGHGVACRHELGNLGPQFILRIGRMLTPGRIETAEIRQIECCVSMEEIAFSYLAPGELALRQFLDVFAKLNNIGEDKRAEVRR